jgi:hypothetical protein
MAIGMAIGVGLGAAVGVAIGIVVLELSEHVFALNCMIGSSTIDYVRGRYTVDPEFNRLPASLKKCRLLQLA